MDSCTSDASLTVSFTAPLSVDNDTTGFIVNCSDNTCVPIVLGPSEEMATLAATDSDHVVNVYTVNRCDQMSDPASGRSQREQLSNGNSFFQVSTTLLSRKKHRRSYFNLQECYNCNW